jgi:hypothetical protein
MVFEKKNTDNWYGKRTWRDIKSEFLNFCFQNVWQSGESSTLLEFIRKIKYCLRLSKNRCYKRNKDKTTQSFEDDFD